nr:MAG TPA: YtxH-like protein [Caudoviricetes sp.]
MWYTVYSEGGDKMIGTFIGSLLGAIIGIMISHTFLHDKGE